MHDYGRLIYLDMQKTGSTTVARFLKKCCTLDRVRRAVHKPLGKPPDPGVHVFTTIRHPLALYTSLFRFGCDGRGAAQRRLRQKGLGHLYRPDNEGFNAWLRVMISSRGIATAYPEYAHAAELGLGLMTIRHLVFSMVQARAQLASCTTRAAAIQVARRHGIVHSVLRTETLADDLRRLAIRTLPQHFDRARVEDFLADAGRSHLNASVSGQGTRFTLESQSRALLREREGYLLDAYYPDAVDRTRDGTSPALRGPAAQRKG